MKILVVEDIELKYAAVRRAIMNSNKVLMKDITRVKYLDDAIDCLKENEYDLVITDMEYPTSTYGPLKDSGDDLIKYMKGEKIDSKIIVCSSLQYDYDDILCVKYSNKTNWDVDISKFIKTNF